MNKLLVFFAICFSFSLFGLTSSSQKQSGKDSKNIISVDKVRSSFQKDGVTDCVEFSSVYQKCELDSEKKKTICLKMVVKNENNVLRCCLESVLSITDTWIIVDTGSKDGTQKTIKEFLEKIPSELHERPWVNFGYNRQEALLLAKDKADYILFMDADDKLVFSENFKMPDLISDFYGIVV
jgi:hypothetical protein